MNNHHAEVVRRVVGHGMVKESLARFLRVFKWSDEIDSLLVLTHIPQLGISSSILRTKPVSQYSPRRMQQ